MDQASIVRPVGLLAALALALAGGAAGAQVPPPRPLAGGPDFISPVGEPYHSTDHLSGAEHWFAATDANGDGRVTLGEYLANADRFFARLDSDHDGMIGPDEIERYETDIAPEVRVVSTGADWQPHGDDDSSASTTKDPYPDRLGAGRYSYVDLPEPVLAMDTNLDRAVSHAEFTAAARRRFTALDTNGDGALTRDELPKVEARAEDGHRRRGHRPRATP